MEIDVDDERFMSRAIQLALEPAFTSPNPRVGAVIVRDGAVIGAAAHEGSGKPHAENAALAAAGDATGATCYVTLEPCAHHGRTPPCAPALVEAGVARVVAAIEDPDERVAGGGFEYLRSHGVRVDVGTLAIEAEDMNAGYLHQRRNGTPLVTVKLAFTLDGRLAAEDGSSVWITGDEARALVHRRRQEVDAVMVGAGTVIADDPSLSVREIPAQRQPARVIVDSSGRVDASASVFRAGAEVIVATTDASHHDRHVAWKEAGAEVLVLPSRDGGVDLRALMEELARRPWIEVMCEGGGELATSLLRDDLAGRMEIYYGAVLVGRGGPDIGSLGVGSLAEAPRFRMVTHERLGDDLRAVYARSED
jgi:diaminohydroxyphosphoribosylaminopyrimidine deaminase/5-amino-6-(5-phosphoribosylamino)uracil reductase